MTTVRNTSPADEQRGGRLREKTRIKEKAKMKWKKWVTVMLTIALSAAMLAGCGKKDGADQAAGEPAQAAPQFDAQTFTIGDFEVTYTGHELMKDVQGHNCIAVHYTFANNSSEFTNFFWNIYDTMMQDGKELSGAYIYTDDDMDMLTDTTVKEVEPGKSIDVTCTYILNSLTSPVQISLSDLMETANHTFEIKIDGMPVAEAFVPEGLAPEKDTSEGSKESSDEAAATEENSSNNNSSEEYDDSDEDYDEDYDDYEDDSEYYDEDYEDYEG